MLGLNEPLRWDPVVTDCVGSPETVQWYHVWRTRVVPDGMGGYIKGSRELAETVPGWAITETVQSFDTVSGGVLGLGEVSRVEVEAVDATGNSSFVCTGGCQ